MTSPAAPESSAAVNRPPRTALAERGFPETRDRSDESQSVRQAYV
jgi:hypothetical protein